MRVVLQGSLGVYGVETFVHMLYHSLKRMGFDVSIAAPFGRTLVRAGRVQRGPREVPEASPYRWDIYRRADLIHLSYALASLPLSFSVGRVPLVYTIHGMPLPEIESETFYKLGYTLERLALRQVAKSAVKVVTISTYAQDLLKKRFGVESLVIRHGVDVRLFRPAQEGTREVLRARLGLPRKGKIVLNVGRLHRSKDPLTLIRCIPDVLFRHPDAHFVLVGDGPMRTIIEAEVSRLKLGDKCSLIPRLEYSSMPLLYQAADFYVSCAPSEMLGMAVLEAMSSGLAVIASDSGGPREVLGSLGVYFKTGNTSDLSDRISLLLNDARMTAGMGQSSREKALRDFRWDEVAKRYADVYASAANGI